VNLPVASRSQEISSERTFVDMPLSYRKDRSVYIGKEPIRLDVLEERVRQLLINRSDRQVFVRAEGQLPVQDLIDVLDTLKAAGVQTAGIVTDLPERR
jgi:biopolymer transport protein ExbD/biopolymer transport protein TolR